MGGIACPGGSRGWGPVWVDGGWEDAGESWGLIELEGWVVGMCADGKEMEGPSRTIHSFS